MRNTVVPGERWYGVWPVVQEQEQGWRNEGRVTCDVTCGKIVGAHARDCTNSNNRKVYVGEGEGNREWRALLFCSILNRGIPFWRDAICGQSLCCPR